MESVSRPEKDGQEWALVRLVAAVTLHSAVLKALGHCASVFHDSMAVDEIR